ncbi:MULTISPECIES: glutamate 5-kinase [unclassified Dyella]|uniref:glutamate 5-kinase n=1 Tax=unclassified Dyella TaxID=2634549 RepID=UPI000C83180C|nr:MULTISPECIES: glutamate 5-kinase [unclassified Dyella]MDR3448073.1 glutamate 5-kinase [Dyella sp.]PMQ05526.1 Glutamate 5-kinase [Dyella sp. AD56]
MSDAISAQALPSWRRAVLKVGSNLLAADGGGLTPRYAAALAGFIQASRVAGRQVVLVSSGAVAAGRAQLRAHAPSGGDLAAKQALAALGQAPMIALWQSLSPCPVAQVLLTHDDLRNRRRYLNARATLRELLALDVLPVVNENDTVAVDELKLGDNDNLAAIVAALVDADLLLIASDIDALYTADPRRDPSAVPLVRVESLTPEIVAMAGGSGSAVGTGGMRTKLEAAAKAAAAGVPTALFSGRHDDTVAALAQGQLRGTYFAAGRSRMQARKYWLRHAPSAPGCVKVDAGAVKALASGRASLLPGGVLEVAGEFHRGDLVEIVDASGRAIARGLCQYGATEVQRLAGRHSRDIDVVLGYSYGAEIVHRDDLATLAEIESTGDIDA